MVLVSSLDNDLRKPEMHRREKSSSRGAPIHRPIMYSETLAFPACFGVNKGVNLRDNSVRH